MVDKTSFRANHSGATAPATLIMFGAIGIVAIITLLFVRGSTVAAHRQFYTRLATSSAQSAINYAQARYQEDADFNGTREVDIIKNSEYRVTISSEIISTTPDGLTKTVRGIGTVYVTDVSQTRAYTYDVVTKTLYTHAKETMPSHFAPIAWFDANDASTIHDPGTATITVSTRTTFGKAADTSRDTLQELLTTGAQTIQSWQSPDLELDACDQVEFPKIDCDARAVKKLQTGVLLRNVNIPVNTPIQSARLTFQTSYVSPGNDSTYEICGIYNPTGAAMPAFTDSQSSQLTNNPAYTRTNTCVKLSTKTPPPSKLFSTDVTSIITEITSQNNWAQPTSENSIGFILSHTSGTGKVSVAKDNIFLSVTHGTSYPAPPLGEKIGEWWDKSHYGNHARIQPSGDYGPTYVADTSKGLYGVRLNQSALYANMTQKVNANEYTILAVVNPDKAVLNAPVENSILSVQSKENGMHYSFLDYSSTNNTFVARPWALNSASLQNGATVICNDARNNCSNKPSILTITSSASGNTITTSLRSNGDEKGSVSATTADDIQLQFDSLTIGGKKSTEKDSSTIATPGEYFELIIFDHRLSCTEVASMENYLRKKWDISAETWDGSCPVQQIPLL